MKRKDFGATTCPVARSLERVGEWWNMMILRDAMYGMTRFDEFEKSLGIAPNMLTRRLNDLVEDGLLARRQYNDKPPRFEYVLTECGHDFRPVLLAMVEWGNKHFSPEGAAIVLVDQETGITAEPTLIDGVSGKPIGAQHVIQPGPAANQNVRNRLAFAAALRNNPAIHPPFPARIILDNTPDAEQA